MVDRIPEYKSGSFRCPHCGAVAEQLWLERASLLATILESLRQIYLDYRVDIIDYKQEAIEQFLGHAEGKLVHALARLFPGDLGVAVCRACSEYSLWVRKQMVYPRKASVEPPNADMDQDIQEVYQEASRVFLDSPRGAAALLRLAVQMLLRQLGKKGKNIDQDIAELVKEGLDPKIQQALDVVRVVGNNAVHPGQIDLNDNRDVALKLFKLVNLIADELITKPKEIRELYEVLPEEAKEHIRARDGKGNQNR